MISYVLGLCGIVCGIQPRPTLLLPQPGRNTALNWEVNESKPRTPLGFGSLRPWGHQHWACTSLGRAPRRCPTLLIPGPLPELNTARERPWGTDTGSVPA